MSHTPVHMHQFLHPRSIAIVGASRNPEKVGNIVIQNLIDAGYTGDIYPINPKAKEIHGFQVYPEINKTPQTPELCIISLPTSLVIQELEQAIDA